MKTSYSRLSADHFYMAMGMHGPATVSPPTY